MCRRRTRSTRFALWAAVCALLLNAAVPLFAAGAARMRGVSIAEVCTVYGVALAGASREQHAGQVRQHADPSGDKDHSSHSAAAHSADHCALTALATLATPDAAMLAVTLAQASTPSALPCANGVTRRDACAAWAARLEHGPPSLA